MTKQSNGTTIGIRKKLALEAHRQLVKYLKKEHPLKELFWECTLRCNLACKHCGSDCRKNAAMEDMPLVDFLQVLDQIKEELDPQQIMIVITGGEPLMREDLEVCGKEITKRGFPWGMVSNGFALTEKRFSKLVDSGLKSLTISLDGFEQEHNNMRGNPNSFLNASRAIQQAASENKILFDVVTCVNKKNLHYLASFKKYLIELGVKSWRIFTIFPIGRAALYPEFQLNNTEFREMMEFINQTRNENELHISYGCEGFLGNYEAKVRDSFYTCHAGLTVASILADGSISSCPSIRANYKQGNIYSDNFMDVWNDKFIPFRDRSWMKKGECADCKVFRYCQGNGMHLRDDNGNLLVCHYKRLQ